MSQFQVPNFEKSEKLQLQKHFESVFGSTFGFSYEVVGRFTVFLRTVSST